MHAVIILCGWESCVAYVPFSKFIELVVVICLFTFPHSCWAHKLHGCVEAVFCVVSLVSLPCSILILKEMCMELNFDVPMIAWWAWTLETYGPYIVFNAFLEVEMKVQVRD